MAFTLDESIPMVSRTCTACRHFHADVDRTCAAFPNGIPLEIWKAENGHRKPYPGDHGIRFEPISEKVLTKA